MDQERSAFWARRSWHWFPAALLVTAGIVAAPIAAVWELRRTGVVTSSWTGLVIAVALSLTVSAVLRRWWSRSSHRTDLLFSELLLWGWLSHLRSERQLADAARVLAGVTEHDAHGAALKGYDRARRERLIRRLADALEAQDAFLHGHSRRVARHAEMIGRRMGLSIAELVRLRAAAAIHDVGKLYVPQEVLDKPAALTDAEYALVKRHSEHGAAMVSILGDKDLTAIVRHHHERIDGRGYPDGLSGEEIPLGARIVAVADTFDAITSPRPYRPAAEHTNALKILRACAGTQLDPAAVEAFVSCYSGRRQVLALTALMALPQRMLGRVGDGTTASSVGTISTGYPLTTLITTAVVGAAAVGVPGVGAPTDPALAKSASSRQVGIGVLQGGKASRAHSPAPPGAGATSVPRLLLHSNASAATVARTASGGGGARQRGHSSTGGSGGSGTNRFSPGSTGAGGRPVRGGGSPPTGGGSSPPAGSSPPQSSGSGGDSHGGGDNQGDGDNQGGGDNRGGGSWPPGHSGEPPPGHDPNGPPGQTGSTPGQDGTPPPGWRGGHPPGHGD